MASNGKKPPNILAIIADDLGWFEVGAYHRGVMGTKTPNIDRIARQGALLKDAYAQASCTAGRAAFITGQISIRGVLKCKVHAATFQAFPPRQAPAGFNVSEILSKALDAAAAGAGNR